jgi:hypothetical protein
MKVEYLFSSRPKSGFSRAISWASAKEGYILQEYPSHMAVLLDETMVVESTLLTGVRIIPYTKWKEINEELYKIPCIHKDRDSRDTLTKATQIWGRGYDWIGILYFAWRFLGLLLLKKELPAHNHWENKDRFFCTEYAGSLTDQNLSMKTPAKICYEWLEACK